MLVRNNDRYKFAPANKLEKLLQKAAKKNGKDKKVVQKFYAELIKSDVFVIPLNRPAIRNGMAADGEVLKLLGYAVNDVFFIAFFTSEERVADVKAQGMGALKLAAKDFFTMTKGSYLVLNPNSGLGKEFFPQEVEGLMIQTDKNID